MHVAACTVIHGKFLLSQDCVRSATVLVMNVATVKNNAVRTCSRTVTVVHVIVVWRATAAIVEHRVAGVHAVCRRDMLESGGERRFRLKRYITRRSSETLRGLHSENQLTRPLVKSK